jgi:hypothetical protein
VPLRSWIKRLERDARGEMASFELLDGSRYYYDRASRDVFLHWAECILAGSAHNWPEPPEVVRKLCEAKDVRRALQELTDPESLGTSGWGCFVYEPEILINERRLEPRGLVTSRDPDTGEWHVRDPYEEPEDLSE